MKTIFKSILSTLALVLFVVSTSFAQGGVQDPSYSHDADKESYEDASATSDAAEIGNDDEVQLGQDMQVEENKVEITQEELPQEVTNSLNEEQYSDWVVSETYELKEEGEKLYEIHFETPEGEMEKETFNENGQVAK